MCVGVCRGVYVCVCVCVRVRVRVRQTHTCMSLFASPCICLSLTAVLLVTGVTAQSALMQEEIFGPLLPVLTVSTVGEAVEFVNARPHPLALYVMSRSKVCTSNSV